MVADHVARSQKRWWTLTPAFGSRSGTRCQSGRSSRAPPSGGGCWAWATSMAPETGRARRHTRGGAWSGPALLASPRLRHAQSGFCGSLIS